MTFVTNLYKKTIIMNKSEQNPLRFANNYVYLQ